MGGYATFAVYQSHPEMIDGLIFANTRATADTPEARANRRNMLALVDREGPSGVARDMMPKLLGKTTHDSNSTVEATVRRLIKQQSPIAIRGAIQRMMHRPDSTPLLPQISVPTLVITGEEDEMIPVEESRRIAAGIAGATLVIVPGAGHLANLEQPEAFNEAFSAFPENCVTHESGHFRPGSCDGHHRSVMALPVHAQQTPPTSDALHRPFDEILDIYVRDGLVYYFALRQERTKFDRYVASLGDVTG